jgi:hypothetical protein
VGALERRRLAGPDPNRQDGEEHEDQAEREAEPAQEDGERDLPAADDASTLKDGPGTQGHDQAGR